MYDSDDQHDQSLPKRIRQSINFFFFRLLSFFGKTTNWFDRILQRSGPSSRQIDDDDDDFQDASRLTRIWRQTWSFLAWIPRKIANAIDVADRQLKRASQSSGTLGESINRADSTLVRWIGLLVRPMVLLGNLARNVFNPAFDLLLATLQNTGILRLFKILMHPIVSTSVFLMTFIRTRSKASRISLAAIASVLVIGMGAFRFFSNQTQSIPKKYRAAFEKAIADGDFAYAQMFQQKLLSLGVPGSQSQLQAINELASSGKAKEAFELAEKLAPLDKPGMPEAHLWLAAQFLNGKSELSSKESVNLAERHLLLLKDSFQRLNPKAKTLPPNVILLWVFVNFKQDKIEEGIKLLDTIADAYPRATLLRFQTRMKLKHVPEAVEDARRLSKAIKLDPDVFDSADEAFFIDWIGALKLENDRDSIKEAVTIWHRKFPENSSALQEWASFELEKIDSLISKGSKDDLSQALRLLIDTTSRLQPQHQPLMTTWFINRLPPAMNDPGYLELARRAADEPLSSMMYEVLGTAAAVRNDNEQAISLLQKAIRIDDRNSIAWNNLAQITHTYFPDRIEFALTAANNAAQLQPNDPTVLYTRGTILAKLGRWEAAILDLVEVLKVNPNLMDAHRTLSIAYRETGQVELAELHEIKCKSGQ